MDILNEIYKSLRYSLKDITIFPGKNLIRVFQIALIITLISSGCYLMDYVFFLDWRGAILGTTILGLIILLGRRKEYGEVTDNGSSSTHERDNTLS